VIDEASARAAAEGARDRHQVPAAYVHQVTSRAIIELPGEAGPHAGKIRDCQAWLVRLSSGAAWVELAVDAETGGVVRVRRSRSGPPVRAEAYR
jgi:hypothetical protein